MTLLLLLACNDGKVEVDDSGTPPADGDTGGDTVPIDWALGDSCESYHQGGFNDFLDADVALVVYGEGDGGLGLEIHEGYADIGAQYFETFEPREVSALTEADREANLFVVGWPAVNPLLAEMNGDLPVWFEDESFVFGGERWAGADEGIAITHPSPFSPGAMVLVFAGNSYDGARNTTSVRTGEDDFVVVTGEGELDQRGELCTDTLPWSYVPVER